MDQKKMSPVLPEYQQVMDDLTRRGFQNTWVTKTVDTNKSGACFLKKGKSGYKADCPHYDGYWLLGGTGSVQCARCSNLLPGIHLNLFCQKNPSSCPYFGGNDKTTP